MWSSTLRWITSQRPSGLQKWWVFTTPPMILTLGPPGGRRNIVCRSQSDWRRRRKESVPSGAMRPKTALSTSAVSCCLPRRSFCTME